MNNIKKAAFSSETPADEGGTNSKRVSRSTLVFFLTYSRSVILAIYFFFLPYIFFAVSKSNFWTG